MDKNRLYASVALGALAFAVFAAAPAAAQQNANSGAVEATLEQINVEGQGTSEGAEGEEEPTDVPAAVSRIDGEKLKVTGRSDLNDIIRSEPGVFTSQNASQPGAAINIRGLEGDGRVNMKIDGVKQNFRFNGHEARGFTYVDPNLLANVDITRGATTGAGGGGLVGGVNFRTIDVDDIVLGGQSWGMLNRVTFGTNGKNISGLTSLGARTDWGGVAAAFSGRKFNDYENGAGVTIPNTWEELQSGLIKANFGVGEDHSFKLGAVFYDNDFFANSYNQTVVNRTYTASYNFNPESDLINLHVNAYANDIDMDYISGTGSAVGRNLNDFGKGFDLYNISLFQLGATNIRTNYGVEYFHDEISGVNSGANPVDAETGVGAAFADATFAWQWAEFTAGLRYDFYSVEGTASTGAIERSDEFLNPKFTLAGPSDFWFQPYVTYAHTYRPPTPNEMFYGGAHGSPGGENPDLLPEESKGWEVGFNVKSNDLLRQGDRLRVKASYYDTDVENYVVMSAAQRFENVAGTTPISGFELGLDYDAGIAFASVSFTHAEADLPDSLLKVTQELPENILTLVGGVRLLDEKLTLGGRYRYVSESFLTDTFGAKNPIPDYHLIDAFASYEVREGIEISLRVENIMDEVYTPAFGRVSTSFVPPFPSTPIQDGLGRTFYLSTQFQF